MRLCDLQLSLRGNHGLRCSAGDCSHSTSARAGERVAAEWAGDRGAARRLGGQHGRGCFGVGVGNRARSCHQLQAAHGRANGPFVHGEKLVSVVARLCIHRIRVSKLRVQSLGSFCAHDNQLRRNTDHVFCFDVVGRLVVLARKTPGGPLTSRLVAVVVVVGGRHICHRPRRDALSPRSCD
jgi:hypothetical protein